jgi:signal peptidase
MTFRKSVGPGALKPQLLLTKGDNNELDDVQLYNGLDYLEKKHIVGKVRG